jgi:hypothetical protein
MSALAQQADIFRRLLHVGFGPGATFCTAAKPGRFRGQFSYAARSTGVSISLRRPPKSIGLVRSASAPFSSALRLVSASPIGGYHDGVAPKVCGINLPTLRFLWRYPCRFKLEEETWSLFFKILSGKPAPLTADQKATPNRKLRPQPSRRLVSSERPTSPC